MGTGDVRAAFQSLVSHVHQTVKVTGTSIMTSPIYEIDGKDFSTLEGFFENVWRLLARSPYSGRTNLDAFNDILSWPEEAYILVWKNSDLSRERLGHSEIARKLERMLSTCHPSNRDSAFQDLQAAREGKGPTMFEWLVEIIEENKPHVTLRLE